MKYCVVLLLLFNALFGESFDVNTIKENKLSSYVSYIKIHNQEHINPYTSSLFTKI
jgi:hypothetical protein